jgi:hypothetical protein
VAVLPADLIAPKGEIEPSLFAADDVGGTTTARVTAALAEATAAGATTDAALKAWGYYRVFGAKAQQLADTPDSMSADGQSQSWGYQRIQYYENKAQRWLSVYSAEMEVPATPPQSGQTRSQSVRPRVIF